MRLRILVPAAAVAILSAGCFETSYEPHGIIERDSIRYSIQDTACFPTEVFEVKPKPLAYDSLTVCLESESMSQCQTSHLGYRYADYKDFRLSSDKFSPAYEIRYTAFKHDRRFDSGSFSFQGAGRPRLANVPETVDIGDTAIRIRFKLDYSDSQYHPAFNMDGKDYAQIRGVDFLARNASVKFIGYRPRFGGRIFLENESYQGKTEPIGSEGAPEIGFNIPSFPGGQVDTLAYRISIVLSPDTAQAYRMQCYESIHDHLIREWNVAKARPTQVKDKDGNPLEIDPAVMLPGLGSAFLIIDKAKDGYACHYAYGTDQAICGLIPHILP